MPEKEGGMWKWWVFGAFASLALIGATTFTSVFPETAVELFDMKGQVGETHFIHLDLLDGLVVSEKVWAAESATVLKLSVFDLAKGKRIAITSDDPDTKCWGVMDDALWCFSTEEGLHSRSPADGRITWNRDDLLAAYPEFKDKLRPNFQDYRFDPAGQAVHFKTNQGFWYTLTARDHKLSKGEDNPPSSSRSYSPTASGVRLDKKTYLALKGSDRKRFKTGDKISQNSFLQALFLIDKQTGQPISFSESTDLAMIHFEKMDEGSRGRGLLLSRVSITGEERWRMAVENIFYEPEDESALRKIITTSMTKHGLFVLFAYDHQGKLFMADPETGSWKWYLEL